MFLNNIDPVLFSVGPLAIRWYSVFFAIGIILYYAITLRLWKNRKWKESDFDKLVLFLFVGLVLGARLGEVFFYQWDYYSSAGIFEIFKVWKGGLSSHGATIGLLVAYIIFCLRTKIRFMDRIDVIAVAMPLVAGFVRLGNFFNSEIVGRAVSADFPFGVVFAQNGEMFARHPAQLYEGLLAWITFTIVISFYLKKIRTSRFKVRNGFFLFLFTGIYFSGRFALEFLKEYQIGSGTDGLPFGLTMGQGLSIIPILISIIGIVACMIRV
ncbi:MAG TPA: prolipoprotein diacylglyceryl transferase, partial [Candidatus Paceibacterota bacterium]|nr:prolipoprotein diacylglyceryl transferase [Candidatus Paceibacterota bacterium]